jgi:hypothetical protein
VQKEVVTVNDVVDDPYELFSGRVSPKQVQLSGVTAAALPATSRVKGGPILRSVSSPAKCSPADAIGKRSPISSTGELY